MLIPQIDLDERAIEIRRLNLFQSALTQLILIQKNLQAQELPIVIKVIPVMNGDLMKIAARPDVYGDYRLWKVIAVANGLKDPKIVGYRDLIIPQVTNQSMPQS